MKALKTTIAALVIGAATILASQSASAHGCGWYAFALATKNYGSAQNAQNRYGGIIHDVDQSNSRNAGQGWWAVSEGPGSKSDARNWRRTFKARGARKAYIGHRCFYG